MYVRKQKFTHGIKDSLPSCKIKENLHRHCIISHEVSSNLKKSVSWKRKVQDAPCSILRKQSVRENDVFALLGLIQFFRVGFF